MQFETESDLKHFFDAHYKSSVQQAFRIVNDLDEAQDIVQDCMVKLWEKKADISKKDNPFFYFKRMVRNRSIDVLRRRIPKDDATALDNLGESPVDTLELSELSTRIDNIIDSLPEKCRQIFVLSRYENMTYKEISNQLNISPKTVETQISRALKVLRRGLAAHFFVLFI